MKFTAIVAAAAAGCVQAQLVCDVLPGMVSLDIQDNQCCAAAIVVVAGGAISTGQGGMLGGKCLHTENAAYAAFFPDGCTDCTQPGDAENIPNCIPNGTPSIPDSMAGLEILCCKEVEGVLCHQSIVAGAGTGSGGVNGMVVGAMDADADGGVDACATVVCPAPTPSPPTHMPTASPPTKTPTHAPTDPPTLSPTATPTTTATPTIMSGASTTALSLVAGAVCAVAGLVM